LLTTGGNCFAINFCADAMFAMPGRVPWASCAQAELVANQKKLKMVIPGPCNRRNKWFICCK